MSIRYAKLCSCDGDKPISITAYHNEMGKQVFMGSFRSTVNEVIEAVGGAEDFTLTGQPTACGKISFLSNTIRYAFSNYFYFCD